MEPLTFSKPGYRLGDIFNGISEQPVVHPISTDTHLDKLHARQTSRSTVDTHTNSLSPTSTSSPLTEHSFDHIPEKSPSSRQGLDELPEVNVTNESSADQKTVPGAPSEEANPLEDHLALEKSSVETEEEKHDENGDTKIISAPIVESSSTCPTLKSPPPPPRSRRKGAPITDVSLASAASIKERNIASLFDRIPTPRRPSSKGRIRSRSSSRAALIGNSLNGWRNNSTEDLNGLDNDEDDIVVTVKKTQSVTHSPLTSAGVRSCQAPYASGALAVADSDTQQLARNEQQPKASVHLPIYESFTSRRYSDNAYVSPREITLCVGGPSIQQTSPGLTTEMATSSTAEEPTPSSIETQESTDSQARYAPPSRHASSEQLISAPLSFLYRPGVMVSYPGSYQEREWEGEPGLGTFTTCEAVPQKPRQSSLPISSHAPSLSMRNYAHICNKERERLAARHERKKQERAEKEKKEAQRIANQQQRETMRLLQAQAQAERRESNFTGIGRVSIMKLKGDKEKVETKEANEVREEDVETEEKENIGKKILGLLHLDKSRRSFKGDGEINPQLHQDIRHRGRRMIAPPEPVTNPEQFYRHRGAQAMLGDTSNEQPLRRKSFSDQPRGGYGDSRSGSADVGMGIAVPYPPTQHPLMQNQTTPTRKKEHSRSNSLPRQFHYKPMSVFGASKPGNKKEGNSPTPSSTSIPPVPQLPKDSAGPIATKVESDTQSEEPPVPVIPLQRRKSLSADAEDEEARFEAQRYVPASPRTLGGLEGPSTSTHPVQDIRDEERRPLVSPAALYEAKVHLPVDVDLSEIHPALRGSASIMRPVE